MIPANTNITFIQRRPSVSDVGPTFYKCYKTVLCLLGYSPSLWTEIQTDAVNVKFSKNYIYFNVSYFKMW